MQVHRSDSRTGSFLDSNERGIIAFGIFRNPTRKRGSPSLTRRTYEYIADTNLLFELLISNGSQGRDHESRFVLRRVRNAAERILRVDSQAHGNRRLSADYVACHEVLCPLRPQGLHPVLGVEG